MSFGPPSNASAPTTTSADSVDTLPVKGYTADQLANYIMRQLGWPTWQVELTKQQILDCIQDALSTFSKWVPVPRPGSIQLIRGQFRYLDGVDVGQGVASVTFVEPNPVPTEIFYGNLINPAPLFRTGLDEYDTFLRWRKTWQRVTSIRPDWYYDEYESVLYIHNPIERYMAGVICFFPYERTERLSAIGADWVKRYALARASNLLGNVWSKFSGAIPGPAQNIQLDQSRRNLAKEEIDALMAEVKGMQLSTALQLD